MDKTEKTIGVYLWQNMTMLDVLAPTFRIGKASGTANAFGGESYE